LFKLALAIFASLNQNSQPELTMDEAVRRALAVHPRLRAALLDLVAAERRVAGASSLTNPSITLTPGFTRAGSDEEVLISQPLELNGTRAARTGIARAKLRAVEAEALGELRDIVFSTKSAFLGLAQAEEGLRLAEDVAKHAGQLDQIARRQVELGSRPGSDRTQTSIELSRAEQQAALARADYEAALAALNTMIGQAPREAVSVVSLAYEGAPTPDETMLIAQALASRTEVHLAAAAQDGFRQEARLARAEGLPDLAPQFRMEGVTRHPREGGFGIAISLPFFDHGSRRNRIKEAEAMAKSEAQRRLAIEAEIRQEVVTAISRLKAAEAVMQSFEGGLLSNARKLLESTLTGFRLGDTSLTTVLEAQRTFRTVEAEHIEALAAHGEALIQLERATGAVPASLLTELRKAEGIKR